MGERVPYHRQLNGHSDDGQTVVVVKNSFLDVKCAEEEEFHSTVHRSKSAPSKMHESFAYSDSDGEGSPRDRDCASNGKITAPPSPPQGPLPAGRVHGDSTSNGSSPSPPQAPQRQSPRFEHSQPAMSGPSGILLSAVQQKSPGAGPRHGSAMSPHDLESFKLDGAAVDFRMEGFDDDEEGGKEKADSRVKQQTQSDCSGIEGSSPFQSLPLTAQVMNQLLAVQMSPQQLWQLGMGASQSSSVQPSMQSTPQMSPQMSPQMVPQQMPQRGMSQLPSPLMSPLVSPQQSPQLEPQHPPQTGHQNGQLQQLQQLQQQLHQQLHQQQRLQQQEETMQQPQQHQQQTQLQSQQPQPPGPQQPGLQPSSKLGLQQASPKLAAQVSPKLGPQSVPKGQQSSPKLGPQSAQLGQQQPSPKLGPQSASAPSVQQQQTSPKLGPQQVLPKQTQFTPVPRLVPCPVGLQTARLQPHTIRHSLNPETGSHQVWWAVDAAKLTGHERQTVSPSFELPFEGQMSFRLVLIPKPNPDGKGGASFKKSGGWGSVWLKCEASKGMVEFLVSISTGRPDAPREPRGPVKHDFSELSTVGLPKSQEQWDFTKAVDKESQTFTVCLDITSHSNA